MAEVSCPPGCLDKFTKVTFYKDKNCHLVQYTRNVDEKAIFDWWKSLGFPVEIKDQELKKKKKK